MKPSTMICRRFGLSQSEFSSFIQTCPYRYKTYPIKRRHSEKKRIISQPSRELKAIQRYVITSFLEQRLPIHDAAKAYRRGVNITDNAKPHLANAYLLKMDFSDFFPSIKGEDFKAYLRNHELVEEGEARILEMLFFKVNDIGELRLSIGSPGSPLISNALMYDFDKTVSDMANKENVAYTRYSDDITFSTNEQNLLFDWPHKIQQILKNQTLPILFLNDKKTIFSSKRHNRHVTGITITNDGEMSVGRSQKRALRSQVHNAHELNSEAIAILRGHIAFTDQVEPGFIEKLKKKYPEQMSQALKFILYN